MRFEEGTVLEGKVTGITKFGAFIALPDGKSGMVHISEVANTYVNDIHDHLSDGQTVKVKVLSVTPEGKVNLSIKNAAAQPREREHRAPVHERRTPKSEEPSQNRGRYAHPVAREGQVAPKTADLSFENKLKQFMQESDSKISGSKLYEQRKSSRRKRY